MIRLLTFVFILTSLSGFSQRNLDSMRQKLITLPADTNRVLLLCDLALKFYNVNVDSVNIYSSEALVLSKQIGYKRGIALSNLRLGYVSLIQGDFQGAISLLEKSISLSDSLGAYDIASRGLNNIGSCMIILDEYYRSIDYFERALKYQEKLTTGKITLTLHMNLAQAYLANRYLPEATVYLNKALAVEEENNPGFGRLLNLFGVLYIESGKYKAADSVLNLAWKRISSQPDILVKTDNRYFFAQSAMKQGKTEDANRYASEALGYSRQLGSTPRLQGIYKILAATELKQGNMQRSLGYLLLADALYDSLRYSHAKNSALLFQKRERDRQMLLDQTERELVQEQKQNQQLIWAGSISILSILALGLLYTLRHKQRTNRKLKGLNRKLVKQKEVIAERNDQLVELNYAKDKLFSILGHDLKSPINSFTGFVRLLSDHIDSLTKDEIKELSLNLEKSLSNLLKLLENLLDWSKSQAGLIDFTPEVVDIQSLLKENQELLDDLAKYKNISIDYDVQSRMVSAQPDSISAVLRNLISNAIKFTNNGGTIAVTTQQVGDMLRVSITDTGIGISAEVVKKLFKISTKYSTLGTANEKGTGLGLVLCKDFVEKNGGTIGVKSTEGKGSTFYFTMPLAD